jgi:hypothetical protein
MIELRRNLIELDTRSTQSKLKESSIDWGAEKGDGSLEIPRIGKLVDLRDADRVQLYL